MTTHSRPRLAADRFQKQRQRTRTELLNAARRVLARRGFHRTKIADIAREAGVAVGTFYLYYPTKEALFVELVEDAVRILRADVDRARAAAADPQSRVRASLATFFHFAQENPDLFRIAFGGGSTVHEVVHRAQELFAADIAANLTQGMAINVFRSNNPEVIAQALIGMSLQVVSWWIDQEQVSLADVTASLFEVISHGVAVSP